MKVNYGEIDEVTSVVLNYWHTMNLINEKPYDDISEKILDRNEKTLTIIKKIQNLIKGGWNDFTTDIEKYQFSGDDILWVYSMLLTQLSLAQSEGLKQFLLSILDKDKIFKDRKKTFYEYGYLVSELAKNIQDKTFRTKFQNLFNIDIRNALAHDDWWFENQKFNFRDKDKNIVQYKFIDFMYEVKKINSVTHYFVARYLQNHRTSHQSYQYYNQLDHQF